MSEKECKLDKKKEERKLLKFLRIGGYIIGGFFVLYNLYKLRKHTEERVCYAKKCAEHAETQAYYTKKIYLYTQNKGSPSISELLI